MGNAILYAWCKAFHVIFMVTWFSGLFYLPRLFVYHTDSHDQRSDQRFVTMEHKLYYIITYPGGILTSIFGLILLYLNPVLLHQFWMQMKITCVIALWIFHLACGVYLHIFQNKTNQHSHIFYRYFNEIPSVILITIVLIANLRPGT